MEKGVVPIHVATTKSLFTDRTMKLAELIKQKTFQSPQQEAMLIRERSGSRG